MTKDGDVYYRTVSWYYDLLLSRVEFNDVDYFRDAIADGGEPALELACGTGRVLLDLVAAGLDVDGVDISPEMVDLCRAKAAERGVSAALYTQPIQELDATRQYRTIFCPVCSFMLLSTPGDAQKALHRCFEHLQPGGRVLIPLYIPFRDGSRTGDSPPPENQWYARHEAERPDGALVRCWSREFHDEKQRLEHCLARNEVLTDGEVVQTETYEMTLRWWSCDEFTAMLTEAGFASVQAFDGLTDRPVADASDLFTMIAERPTKS